jgi:hypothetical protein
MWTSSKWPRIFIPLLLFAACLMSVRVIRSALSAPEPAGAGNGDDLPEPRDGPAPRDAIPDSAVSTRDLFPPDPFLDRPLPFAATARPPAEPPAGPPPRPRRRRRRVSGRAVRDWLLAAAAVAAVCVYYWQWRTYTDQMAVLKDQLSQIRRQADADGQQLAQLRRQGDSLEQQMRARLVLRDGIDLVHVVPNDPAKVTVIFDNVGTTPAYDLRQESVVAETYTPPPDCSAITANPADLSQYVGREVRFNLQSATPLAGSVRRVFVSGRLCYHDIFGTTMHWTSFCVQIDVAAGSKLTAARCAQGNDADH